MQLDLSKASTPALGEEQVLDVELNRHMEFLPQRTNRLPTRWDDAEIQRKKASQVPVAPEPREWFFANFGASCAHRHACPAVLGYIKRLRALLPKFPMTARGDDGPNHTL